MEVLDQNDEILFRSSCRLCDSSHLTLEVSLPHSVIADKYFIKPNTRVDKYPLHLYQCHACGHIQALDVMPLSTLFDQNYTYKPSKNPALVTHFKNYALLVDKHCTSSNQDRKSLDIGSNDGLFLESLKNIGFDVLGIEPSMAASSAAHTRGINTIQRFFDESEAAIISQKFGLFDHISANNVYAHNDDLQGFTQGVSNLLKDSGIFTFEISYLADIIERRLIGTVFHEHLSHHSLLSLIPFLRKYNLHLIDAVKVNTQGGALIGVAKKGQAVNDLRSDALLHILAKEESMGLASIQSGALLRKNFCDLSNEFNKKFNNVVSTANRVIGYGAARSSNLLIEFLQIKDDLDLIIDSNPEKCGKYLYNSNIQITSEKQFDFQPGDLVIPLAWVHSENIVKKLSLLEEVSVLTFYPSVKLYKK